MSHGSGSYTRAMRLWASGMPVRDIAEQCGLPYGTVMNWAYHHRDDFPARRRSARLTDGQRERIRAMRAQGMTHDSIAKAMGVCRSTVAKVLRHD